ncbi:twin-arginine translocase TatA/TatE family subunit [Helicobacter sp. 23-1044]
MAPSFWNVVVILVVILLLFGGKKIPELAKGLGAGIKNFKNAVKDDESDIKTISKDEQNAPKNDEQKA